MKSNTPSNLDQLLEVYTIEEILEINDLTPIDALRILIESGEIELPEHKPVLWDEIDTLTELDEETEI